MNMTRQNQVKVLKDRKQQLLTKYQIISENLYDGVKQFGNAKPLETQKQETAEEIKKIDFLLTKAAWE